MRVCPKRAGPDVWIPADISGSPGCRAAAGRSRLARAAGGGVPTLWCVFLFGTGPPRAGPVILVKKIRAAVGEFVRGSRDRDLVAYYDSV
jgi:hypothetical protein